MIPAIHYTLILALFSSSGHVTVTQHDYPTIETCQAAMLWAKTYATFGHGGTAFQIFHDPDGDFIGAQCMKVVTP